MSAIHFEVCDPPTNGAHPNPYFFRQRLLRHIPPLPELITCLHEIAEPDLSWRCRSSHVAIGPSNGVQEQEHPWRIEGEGDGGLPGGVKRTGKMYID